MGLFQKAVETYDAMVKDHAGVYKEGQKEPLAPIGHIIAKAKIQITIDQNGEFQEARKNEDKIIIPTTIDSANRSSTKANENTHPLCEKLSYIVSGEDIILNNEECKNLLSELGELEKNKKENKIEIKEQNQRIKEYIQQNSESFNVRKEYLTPLQKWKNSKFSHPIIKAVFKYIEKKTIIKDLLGSELISILIKKDKINIPDDLICWRVIGIGNEKANCWENKNLMKAHQDYLKQNNGNNKFCMISGKEELLCPNSRHTKGVVSHFGNAKLISSDDNSNVCKYRGRFTDDQQACTVSYESSQKAHNALKWLIANEGVRYGGKTFLCWNPNGKEIPKPTNPYLPSNNTSPKTPTDYATQLNDAISGWQNKLPKSEGVIIVVFDAATDGRLSINYYNELIGSDFLGRLKYWDETCCWYHYQGISSPTLRQIASYAFGTLRNKGEKTSVEIDDKVLGQQIQRLLMCRVNKALFPFDIFQALIQKTSNLQIYEFDDREKLLFITCAVIKKYKYDHYKETIEMSLKSDRKDRSYQYGRLVAILEKIEKDTYKDEKRESNIIRRLSTFIKTPLKVSADIMTQLKSAYYPQLSSPSRTFYDKLIGEIMEIIDQLGDKDKPLSETYIIGYYLQQKELYKSNKNNTNNTEEQNNAQ